MARSILALLVITVFGTILAYTLLFSGKIYPNIYVAGINVGGLNRDDASKLLSKQVMMPPKVHLTSPVSPFEFFTSGSATFDFDQTVQNAYDIGRTGNIITDFINKFDVLVRPVNLGVSTSINDESFQKTASLISGEYYQAPVYPSLSIVSGTIKVNKGLPGYELDQDGLKAKIIQKLSFLDKNDVEIPLHMVDPTINDSQAQNWKGLGEKYLGKSLDLKFEYISIIYKDSDLLSLINPDGSINDLIFDKNTEDIKAKIERDPQNAKFTFDGTKVAEFAPAKDGIKLDKNGFKQKLSETMISLSQNPKADPIEIPTLKTPPEITVDKINNLGIKELIGRGDSTYFNSIPSRVHNVVLAASNLSGTVIPPGQTFSFNETLGDVSKFTGYQSAYIIKDGKTILGDGGGVCQVSTTLFRAVLNAGLPINERHPHAYRVGYYEQGYPPGLDATVYAPSPDFKFTNDTGNYILIEATPDPKNYSLIFELYGTKDGRVATITKPVITSSIAPPPDLYQDDPTLPSGQVKQIEHKAWGAKVVFDYKVERDGQTVYQKTFVSNYRPWQAVYLRGTGL